MLFAHNSQLLALPAALALESGQVLPQVTVAYRTWGTLTATRDNGVLVCHALTGSQDVDRWWRDLLGPGKALDPKRDFILCSNVLGGCYGSTGPRSINPVTRRPYGGDFPVISIRDIVHTQARWLELLGIARLQLIIGGSFGGMQVLEWAALYPDRVQSMVPMAVSGQQPAWAIGLSETQRQAIYADSHWRGGHYSPDQAPLRGLAAARMLAMCTYRHWLHFNHRFGRQRDAAGDFQVENYLRYQGAKLAGRFDAVSYVRLSQAMDTHDLGRGRSAYLSALAAIATPAMVVGVRSDVLYPPPEQADLAAGLANAKLVVLDSPHGHDGFLTETAQLNPLVLKFRTRPFKSGRGGGYDGSKAWVP